MELSIKAYNEAYQPAVEELITEDSYVQADVIKCLKEWPECGLIIEGACGLIAVGVFTGVSWDKKTSMTLYVKPSVKKKRNRVLFVTGTRRGYEKQRCSSRGK